MATTNLAKELKELGATGTQIINGQIVNEEPNRKLDGPKAIAEYDVMRRNDATVSIALDGIKLPLRAAEWVVDPPEGADAKGAEITEYVRWNLFERINWNDTLEEILTYLDFGFSLHEMVFVPEMVSGATRTVLDKLAYRKQTTIYKWETHDGKPGVTQMLWNGEQPDIPAAKLAHFINRPEGDNKLGRSLLRAAYKHWFYKDKFYQIEAVGFERQALGVVEIIAPDDKESKDSKAIVKAARLMRASEQSYIKHTKDWQISFMDMKGNTLKDPTKSIEHHDHKILLNVMMQFLLLGSGGTSGNRSVSEDHSRLYELSLRAVADKVASVVNERVIKTLVDLNFTTTAYPKLRAAKVGEIDLQRISESVSKLTEAGYITPRPNDENYFRRMVGMEEVSEEDLAKQTTDDDAKTDDLDEVQASVVMAETKRLQAALTRQLYGKPKQPTKT